MSEIRREMLGKIGSSWEALQQALGRVPPNRLEEAGVVEAWSVKDLIGHVTSWERQAMKTIGAFQEDGDAAVLEWAEVDEFNAVMAEANSARALQELRSDMMAVHDDFLDFIEGLSAGVAEERLVQRRVRVDGYEHYAEHSEQILEWLSNSSTR